MESTLAVSQDDHDKVYQLIMAGWGAQAVRTLAALSVAENLAAGPLSAGQIAERESSDLDMTYRVLRAGAALGLLEYDAATQMFSGTTALEVLQKDSPFCLKHYAQVANSDAFWLPGLRLPETVKRGENQVTEVLGCSVTRIWPAWSSTFPQSCSVWPNMRGDAVSRNGWREWRATSSSRCPPPTCTSSSSCCTTWTTGHAHES
jgi:hypothetical protein